jgi:hypothetical protein
MKVLIQHIKSGQYLSPNGSWSATAGEARDFRYSSYAHSVMKKEQTRGLRVLFYFEELDYSVTVRRGSSGERLCERLSAGACDF